MIQDSAHRMVTDSQINTWNSLSAGVNTGDIIYRTSNTVPTGYLKANGALVSRTTYANLFSVIGTTFGAGDGSTTFNLPDLRGEFIRGWDDGRGIDSGRTLGSYQADGFKSHTHLLKYWIQSGGNPRNSYYPSLMQAGDSSAPVSYPAYGIIENPISYIGDVETRPKNIALMAIIKY